MSMLHERHASELVLLLSRFACVRMVTFSSLARLALVYQLLAFEATTSLTTMSSFCQ